MRVLTISGRIVADAQKQISQQGREFMTFRLANNEFGDEKDAQGKPITYWFRVTSFNPRCLNMVKYLTKGKPINVIGSYSDSMYTNKNTGNCEISRDIIADRIEFEVGNYESTQNGNTTQPQVTTQQSNVVDIPKVTSSTVQTTPTNNVNDASDDLPF